MNREFIQEGYVKKTRSVVLLLFFLSGVSGLVYEVVWVRMLGLIFGTTVYAVSTVLTSFMAGLGLGSFWFGRVIDKRKDPLAVYGRLQIGIGIYCLLIPLLFKVLTQGYIGIYQLVSPSSYTFGLIRFILAFVVLVIPTTLMGATFPVISKFFVRWREELGWEIGRVRFFCGFLTGGFCLFPELALRQQLSPRLLPVLE